MTSGPIVDTPTFERNLRTSPPLEGTNDDDSPQKTRRSQSKQRQSSSNNNGSSSNSKKKPQAKNKKKKQSYRPAYLDAIQQEIDELKKQETGQDTKLDTDKDEKSKLENRQSTSTMITKLEELKLKLSTPEMLQKSSRDRDHYTQPCNTQQSTELTQRFEQETLTLLHFFYIVRLAQKGLFDIISQSYPEVEPNALVHLCDKLVGGSLFVVKDPVEKVRSEKRGQVFDLLRKLHDGAPESIADGFSTTFKQVRHLVFDFIDSTTSSSSPFITQQSNLYQDNSIGYKDNMNEQPQQQYPVWVMVPFQGMIGESHLQSTSPASNFTGHQKPKNGSQEQSDEKSHPRRTTGNTTNTTKASSIGNSGTEKRVNGSVTPEEKEPNTRNTMDHDEIKTQQQKDTSHDSNSDTNTPSVKESSITHANDPEQLNTTLSKDMQSPSGWESTRATTSTASSSSWSQGDTDQRKLDETTGDTTKDDEWGSPSIGSDAKPQVWDGRPPDDWNEMRSGGVSDRPWHPTHQRRGGHRGRSSGFRGGGGGGQGRGNYRSQGDEFRGGRGRGGGGPRRGSTNSGWNTTRPPRSD